MYIHDSIFSGEQEIHYNAYSELRIQKIKSFSDFIENSKSLSNFITKYFKPCSSPPW